MTSEELRAYWRKKQAEHRAKKKIDVPNPTAKEEK